MRFVIFVYEKDVYMSTKRPQVLSAADIYGRLSSETLSDCNVHFSNELGLILGLNVRGIFKDVIGVNQPALLEEYRIALVKRGCIQCMINLTERKLAAGTILFTTPGTIVEKQSVSDDLLLEGMCIPSDLFQLAHKGILPEMFRGAVRDGQHQLTKAEDIELVDRMFHVLYSLVESDYANSDSIYNIIATITTYYNRVFADKAQKKSAITRANEIFDSFIRLVNLNCRKERRMSFYASKICVTERYLGTVVRQVSGVTAKEWIDRAVMSEAKVMLRHSVLQISQISDELNFPNPSFFCKFFKRNAGKSPQEYRDMAL